MKHEFTEISDTRKALSVEIPPDMVEAEIERTAQKNPFYREPNHIRTAAELGLGVWDLAKIDRRRLEVGGQTGV